MLFYRCIGNLKLGVFIDFCLYKQNQFVFDALLRTYRPVMKASEIDPEHIIYIVCDNYHLCRCHQHIIVCNTQDTSWIFSLINQLEDFYSSILKCTVLHGCCLQMNGKNILIVGERWTGKTTLTRYLTLDNPGIFLNDDCVYYYNNAIVGFGMPLPIRNAPIRQHAACFVAKTMDFDGQERFLYSPPNVLAEFSHVDLVIFPKYAPAQHAHIEIISPGNAFRELIFNVRAHGTMQTLYDDIKQLSMYTNCYRIKYQECKAVLDFLEERQCYEEMV